ncbi:MAG: hypothetical protein ACXW1R_04520 [Halobacteriota archaeon]
MTPTGYLRLKRYHRAKNIPIKYATIEPCMTLPIRIENDDIPFFIRAGIKALKGTT